MTTNAAVQPHFRPAGFFALRTPLLPWDEFLAWGEGVPADGPQAETSADVQRERVRRRLRDLYDRPEVRDAVFVASPSLCDALNTWRAAPESPRGQKAERALVRYFSRMAGRPTPFGLFAGCAVGRLSANTSLSVPPLDQVTRCTRLDHEYVLGLAEALTKVASVRESLLFRPNSTLYQAAGQWRYAESRLAAGRRSHHLVALEENDVLTATLHRAAGGARIDELAAALVDDDVTRDEAREFIHELIDSQLLESELLPALTGPEPLPTMIERLEATGGAAYAARLRYVHDALRALDSQRFVEADNYRTIAAALSELPAPVDLPRLFQVDLYKPAAQALLSTQVIDELARGVQWLASLTDSGAADPLAEFRRAFVERYGTREVPLVEALDEELGVGFAISHAPESEGAPLLAGIAVSPPADLTLPWRKKHAALLAKISAAAAEGRWHIELSPDDLTHMAADEPAHIPGALSVMASLLAPSVDAVEQGDFQVFLQGAVGPSGARMLGRFCHGDPELHRLVLEHLRAEEAQAPEAIFAELVHLPEGRTGNVLLRPVLRDYEIAYLGQSGAPADRQIPVTDLLVSVQGERIVLRSAALGREIIPRLTNAHNYVLHGLGLYRFLCALQNQNGTGGLFWTWGPLEGAPFLPRVTTGRLILARARWRVANEEIQALSSAEEHQRFAAVQAWRARRRLPRFVAWQEDDHELPIDLDNPLSVEAALDALKGREHATLVEMLVDGLVAVGPEGRYVHELVVPLTVEQPRRTPPPAKIDLGSVPRRFTAGSEWLYAKIYSGAAVADRLLRRELREAVDNLARAGVCDRWFFIRYGDPEPHLRLRLHGRSDRLLTQAMPCLAEVLQAGLEQGWVARLQYDTYDREVERYGGSAGIELAEHIFWADSVAAMSIVDFCRGDPGLDARWRLAMRGIDQLLDDLGFDLRQKSDFVRRARDNFALEFRAGDAFRHQTSQRFRAERASLDAILDRDHDATSLLAPCLAVLDERSRVLRPLASALKALAQDGRLTVTLPDLAGSFAHMWVNRLLRSAQRAQELVLYDFLDRLYESRLARTRAGRRSGRELVSA